MKDFDLIDKQAERESRALKQQRQHYNYRYKRIRQQLNYNQTKFDMLFIPERKMGKCKYRNVKSKCVLDPKQYPDCKGCEYYHEDEYIRCTAPAELLIHKGCIE